MKTEEFVEAVENLGHNIEYEECKVMYESDQYINDEYIWILDDNKDVLMRVNTNEIFVINTDYYAFRQLGREDKRELLDVVLKYIKNPFKEEV